MTRHTLVMAITIGVGVLLLGLMVFVYTHKKPVEQNDSGSRIKDFYTTILENGQSYFTSK